jgi:hypothetical protein
VKKAIRRSVGGKRPGAGRKPTGTDPARTIRLSDEFIAHVDSWAAAQHDQPGRSEAIRRLVEIGLHAGASVEDVRVHNKASDYATEASELAKQLGLKAKGSPK